MFGGKVQRGLLVGAAFARVTLRLLGAQAGPEAASGSYHVTRYTAEQGLPQNTVRALLQTGGKGYCARFVVRKSGGIRLPAIRGENRSKMCRGFV
jgi:hypothetical protein